jgi:hypothetical protein
VKLRYFPYVQQRCITYEMAASPSVHRSSHACVSPCEIWCSNLLIGTHQDDEHGKQTPEHVRTVESTGLAAGCGVSHNAAVNTEDRLLVPHGRLGDNETEAVEGHPMFGEVCSQVAWYDLALLEVGQWTRHHIQHTNV